jgi:hypothetical protein
LDKLDDFRLLACLPYLEEVTANVTLTLPDLAIAAEAPPVALEHTTKFSSNYYLLPNGLRLRNVPSTDSFDGFSNYLVCRRDGVPANELLTNSSHLLETAEKLYQTYVAQILNTDQFRVKIPARQNKSIDAIFTTNSHRQRLVQHGLSTRPLEGVLALIFLCAVVAYTSIWRSTNGTRRNPAEELVQCRQCR